MRTTCDSRPGDDVPSIYEIGREPMMDADSRDAVRHRAAVVTSVGLCTVLGDTLDQTWHSLRAGRFIADHSRIDVKPLPGEARVTALARRAANEATTEPTRRRIRGDARTAIVVGTSKGPVEQWLDPQSTAPAGELQGWGLSSTASTLAREFGIQGPCLTISAACASGLHALFRANLLIRSGEADRVLVVAAEASVHPLFIGSFQRLGVLAGKGVGCRPLDRARAGFLMSDAAAAVWLCAADLAPQLPEISSHAPRRVIVESALIAGDAVHLTHGDDQTRALRRLLRDSARAGPFDLIHAHATGTVVNDAGELAAIDEELGRLDRPPIVYSHKGALGHSLGAAGLVSIVLNWQSHQTGIIPPNIQTTDPLDAKRVEIYPTERALPEIHRSIAIAAGFGGAMGVATLIQIP